VNVDPLFQFTSSILNSFSLIPHYNQEIEVPTSEDQPSGRDGYKKQLTAKIVDVFSIKIPDLIINDLFYVLEGAGPSIYEDSRLKKTSTMILGNNAVSVDYVTMKVLNLEKDNNDLLNLATARGLGPAEISKITILGESIENVSQDIKNCPDNLRDIDLINFNLQIGDICSACFKQAYHLLNLIKTFMIKDQKYLPSTDLLVGENPPSIDDSHACLVFGDCAIKSTKDYAFRTKKIEKTTRKGKTNVKVKPNKKVLEIVGCPPDINDTFDAMLDYYRKSKMPCLYLLNELMSSKIHEDLNKNLKIWEGL